jgi:ribosomal protein RSM22 (predicted rRNA methylase)
VVVEAGTPHGSATVAALRQTLLQHNPNDSSLVAPCPHARACPLAAPRLPATARQPHAQGQQQQQQQQHQQDTPAPEVHASTKATAWCHFTQRISAPSFHKVVQKQICKERGGGVVGSSGRGREGQGQGGARAESKAYIDWKFSFVALARNAALLPPPPPPLSPAGDALLPSHPSPSDHWGRVLRWPMKRSHPLYWPPPMLFLSRPRYPLSPLALPLAHTWQTLSVRVGMEDGVEAER